MTDQPFVMAPLAILEADNLSDSDKLTWLGIRSYCYNGSDSCRPGGYRIRKRQGLTCSQRKIIRAVKRLEEAGFLRVTRTPGKENEYYPVIPVTPASLVTQEVVPNLSPVTPEVPVSEPTSDKFDTGPVTPVSPPRIYVFREEKEKSTPLTPLEGGNSSPVESLPKKTRKKRQSYDDKYPLLTDPELIKAAISEIDLDRVRKMFPEVDVDLVLVSFRDIAMEGTAKKPGANPYKWRWWQKAFETFCRNQIRFYADKHQAQRHDPYSYERQKADEEARLVAERLAYEAQKAKEARELRTAAALREEADREWEAIRTLPPDEYSALEKEARRRVEAEGTKPGNISYGLKLEIEIMSVFRENRHPP